MKLLIRLFGKRKSFTCASWSTMGNEEQKFWKGGSEKIKTIMKTMEGPFDNFSPEEKGAFSMCPLQDITITHDDEKKAWIVHLEVEIAP